MEFGGDTFGLGTTKERFNFSGKVPWSIEELYISDNTGASSKAKVFNTLFGMPSVPYMILLF
jgi:hypothetical protein